MSRRRSRPATKDASSARERDRCERWAAGRRWEHRLPVRGWAPAKRVGPSQASGRSLRLARSGHIHPSRFACEGADSLRHHSDDTWRVRHAVVLCVGMCIGPTRRCGLDNVSSPTSYRVSQQLVAGDACRKTAGLWDSPARGPGDLAHLVPPPPVLPAAASSVVQQRRRSRDLRARSRRRGFLFNANAWNRRAGIR